MPFRHRLIHPTLLGDESYISISTAHAVVYMSDATFYSSEANRKGLMDMACLLPLIILLLLLSSLPSRSDDQLTQGKPLFPGDKLISKNGVFALGFFLSRHKLLRLWRKSWAEESASRSPSRS